MSPLPPKRASEEQTGQPRGQFGEKIEEKYQRHHGQKIGNDMAEDSDHGHIFGRRADGEHVDAHRRGDLAHFHEHHADHAEPHAVKADGLDAGVNGRRVSNTMGITFIMQPSTM